ncbi:helix-turn-helix domain-containing protein [Longispora albida]|uniref:helix-turn-helix domain-containing protein n=1 Tax=Longispora albida TaxID=203523 RepID=UPI00037857FC|nr:helix-turn-helix transcriptional regulator [Longispora albida]
MLTLAGLITEQHGRITHEALAAAVGLDAGGLRKLRDGVNTEFPFPATLRELAAALGVTQLGAVQAAAQGLGIDMGLSETPRRTFAADLPPETDEIPGPLLDTILDLTWGLVDLALGVQRYEVPPQPAPATLTGPTLAGLIGAHRGERSLAELARDVGVKSPTTVQRLAKGENSEFPRVATIHGLARALGVTPGEVVLATAAGLGFRMDGAAALSFFAHRIPPEADELPEPSKEAIHSAVRAALAIIYATEAPPQTDNIISIVGKRRK